MTMARLCPTSTTSASCLLSRRCRVFGRASRNATSPGQAVELTRSIAHLSTEVIGAACSLVDPRHRSKIAIALQKSISRGRRIAFALGIRSFSNYIGPGSVGERRLEKQEDPMFDNETQERIDRFMKVRVDEGLKIDPRPQRSGGSTSGS